MDGGVHRSPGDRLRVTRRAEFERRQRRRSTLIATTSTVVVVAVLALLVPRSPGWDKVRAQFFDADKFGEVLPKMIGPFWLDVRIFLVCSVAIVVVGLAVAMARNVRSPALYPLRLFATLYTDIVRGVPVLLWITMIGFGVPGLLQTRAWYGKVIIWGSAALIMTYSAYVAEVFRAGIESVHESQRAASRSLGLSVRRRCATSCSPKRSEGSSRR